MKKKVFILLFIFSLILAVACSPEIPADQPYMGEEEEIKTQWVDGTHLATFTHTAGRGWGQKPLRNL